MFLKAKHAQFNQKTDIFGLPNESELYRVASFLTAGQGEPRRPWVRGCSPPHSPPNGGLVTVHEMLSYILCTLVQNCP